uniref:Alpha-2-macroglobulin-like n=1 Tax=Labrus bergylta TaxID=56723 RepID=A0A3Q3GEY7_9LABR
MTITLRTKQATLTLLHKISSLEFHNVFKFQVPSGLKDEVADFEVELRGAKFYSKEVRKVMIRTYEPMTFVQTDKPIYLPGQTVKFRVVTIDTKFRPATQLVSDPNSNKIGQWLKETSNGKILQLSFSLNAEAREGIYNIIVSIGENKIYWNFKVEKYVLPKFEVNIKAPDKVSIGQEEIKVKVCAQYTYKQSVPGLITAEMCRPLYRYIRETEDIKPPCFVETMEVQLPYNTPERRPPYNVEEGYFEILQHKISMTRDVSVDSKTVSSLEVQKKEKPIPCDTVEKISVKFTIVGERQGTATFIYVVSDGLTQGEMSINIRVSPEMSPDVQLVAYAVLPSEMVIAHSADFSTEKCFSISLCQVSLEFFPSSAVPGEGNTLQVTAQPNSLCGVSIVDQSVLIKEPGKSLDSNRVMIFDLLPITKVYYIPFEVLDTIECLVVRPKRSIWPRPDNVGLKMATNLGVRVPSCLQYGGRKYVPDQGDLFIYCYVVFYEPMPMNPQLAEASGGTLPPPIVTVRTFFPETWIWDLIEIGETGTKNVPLTVPDTITTWETEAFCLSSQGFGLAPRKELTVFQPFFLELSLPYSIIRGENFELKATVFNYLSSCIMVTVTPAPSSDFTLFPYLEDEFRTCLCGNERKSFRWTLTPSVIGDVIVSATAEAVVSDITCNNEVVSVPERGRSDTVSRTLKVKAEGIEKIKSSNLLLCPNGNFAVFFYSRVSVLLSGDIMGRALKNLDGLLRMPYGCAEQNMAVLAPNIYILQYLEDTKQLTPDIKAKGTNFLTSGYQRQLNYKNNDGAFSTFGSGGSGNTWLTAFTMRSFVKAQNFIFIDPKVINDAMIWLTNSQKGSGNFKLMGKFFNNQIKSYDLLLLLIILFSLNLLQETVTKSLSFTLTTATNRYLSVSVEMTSYVLLALLSPYSLPAAPPSPEALGYASGIVRWLTRQQKYYGGFSSTQDTVVALQALALYSTLVFNPEGSSSVNVNEPGQQAGYQEHCFSAQTYLNYKNPLQEPQIVCVPANKKASVTLSKIYFFLLCYRYTGKRETTNMVIVDIKMLSGFLKGEAQVERIEHEDDHVVVYIKELSKDIPIQYDLELRQELPVSDLKPAVVKIYDYYQQSKPDTFSALDIIYRDHYSL